MPFYFLLFDATLASDNFLYRKKEVTKKVCNNMKIQ